MRYYPVNLDLKEQPVIIVGGGRVAARKAQRLVEAGARLTVIAPHLAPSLAKLCEAHALQHLERCYRSGDLAGARLVFAATDDPQTNGAVAREARQRGILVDIVDAPAAGDFTTPALLEQGELLIAVSTGGASPAYARRIIEQLKPLFGPEHAEALALLGELREKILTVKGGCAYNEHVFSELVALDLPNLIKNGSREAIDRMLLKLLGPEFVPVVGAEEKDPS